jgi:hypothetical protein
MSNAAQRILRNLEQATTTKIKPSQRKDLQECVTQFGNHLHQMRYARYIDNGIPIGSGVTEAACETLGQTRVVLFGNSLDPKRCTNRPKPASPRPRRNSSGKRSTSVAFLNYPNNGPHPNVAARDAGPDSNRVIISIAIVKSRTTVIQTLKIERACAREEALLFWIVLSLRRKA